MIINLIDSLLDEKPHIDVDSFRIHSNILLSDVLGYDVTSDEKSELVNIPYHLDEINNDCNYYNSSGRTYNNNYNYNFSKYRDMWGSLGLNKVVISKKLFNFLLFDTGLSFIGKIFSMDKQFVIENKEKVKECFSIISEKFNYLIESEDGYLLYGEKRSKIRYGKFINMIGEIFYDNGDTYRYKMKYLENSVDIYKSKFNTKGYRISVLNGDDILLGYKRRYQYKKSGTILEQSCMNDKLNILKLYSNNPDKIYLFVVTNDDGKIVSRNLVWRLKKYNNFLFDRIYTIDNYIHKSIKDLAVNEGWITYNEGRGIEELKKIDKDGNPKKVRGKTVKIKLNFKGIKSYPYLDTFRYQRRWTNTLTNRRMNRLCYKYEQTGGCRSKM